MKKILSLILALCLLMSMGSLAAAAQPNTQAELCYREVKIFVDGKQLVPLDANGESTEPFIIDGTTYLPVRAVSGALGLEVDWDGATSTIYLKSGGEINYGSGQAVLSRKIVYATPGYRNIRILLNGLPIALTDANGKRVEPFIIDNTTYVPVRAIANALGLEVGWNGATSTVILDSGKGYYPSLISRSINGPDGSRSETLEFSYTEEGAPTQVKLRSSDGSSLTVSLRYDSEKRLTRLSVTGSRSFGYEYKYDSAGRMNYEKTWQGSDYTERRLSFDEKGRLSAETLTRRSGGVTEKTELSYSYDSKGRLARESSRTGGAETVTEYSYNSDGSLACTTVTEGKSSFRSEYKYDSKGNLLGIYNYLNNYLNSQTEYEYDASGNMTLERVVYPQIEKTTRYVYDEGGKLVSESYSDSDGLEILKEYEYDRYGNLSASSVEERGINYGGEYVYTESYEYEHSVDGLLLWRSRSDSRGNESSFSANYDPLGRCIFSETLAGSTLSSSYMAEYELGPRPVYEASSSLGSGSIITETQLKVFPDDSYAELVEQICSLLDAE